MPSSWTRSIGIGAAVALLATLVACGGGVGSGGGATGCVSTAIVICTQSGQLQGAVEGTLRAFRGIPFAAPPVGDLRWKPPAPPASWQGVRNATSFGNRCPQMANGVPVGDEDCLTLDVYAMNPPSTSKQPVIVWIHGGGQIVGSAQDPPWSVAPPLAGHGVVVTVEYRLGLLGFMANPLLTAESTQGSSGNYGLMDLVAALKWVRANIAEFGGDPDHVMIVGHSWGSVAVETLLASPAAQGLFTAAGMESGVFKGGLIGTIDNAYRWYADVPGAVGCGPGSDVLACLRAVPASTLVASSQNNYDTGWPSIEPVVLPEDPYLKLQRLGSPVPLIIGSNSDEMAPSYVFAAPLDAAGYAGSLHAQFDPIEAGAGDTVLSLYPATDFTNPNYALESVESDLYYTRGTRNLARDASGAGRPKVWRYLFTHRYENPAPQDSFVTAMRAFHGAETFFVSGNFKTLGTSVTYSPSDAEAALSDAIMGYWTRLAAAGDPNGAGAVEWLPYDVATENILELDNSIVTLPGGYRNPQIDFLSSLPIRY